MLDAILGTPDNLQQWEEELLAYSASTAPMPKSKREKPSVSPADLAERVTPLAAQRARALLRRSFGDIGEARDVLERLTELIDTLDDTAQDDTVNDMASATAKARADTDRTTSRRTKPRASTDADKRRR